MDDDGRDNVPDKKPGAMSICAILWTEVLHSCHKQLEKQDDVCNRGLQTPGLGTGQAPAVPGSEWAKSWRRQAAW